MRLDIHTHSTYSDCSSLDTFTICERVVKDKIPVFTVTDHGNTKACAVLEKHCPDSAIVWGVEITAKEGDFLVYSLDADYVKSLKVYQDSVNCLRKDDVTAVIWAHPRVPHKKSMGWTSPQVKGEIIEEVVPFIDGLEIFNGTMLYLAATGVVKMNYFYNLRDLAKTYNLTLTGGSDAHEKGRFYTAWTDFPDDVKSPEQFVQALKNHNVKPNYSREFYKIDVQLEL